MTREYTMNFNAENGTLASFNFTDDDLPYLQGFAGGNTAVAPKRPSVSRNGGLPLPSYSGNDTDCECKAEDEERDEEPTVNAELSPWDLRRTVNRSVTLNSRPPFGKGPKVKRTGGLPLPASPVQ